MRKNNRGLSLLELIIAFAILGIVSLVLLGFMTTSGRMYNSVSAELSLQLKSQIAMAQIKEYAVDCNEGICFDGNSLYILDSKTAYDVNSGDVITGESKTYTCHIFRYDAAEGTILYGKTDEFIAPADQATLDTQIAALTSAFATDLLADGVKSFTAVYNNVDGSITSLLELRDRNKEYAGSQTISLRNGPKYASSINSLLTDIFRIE